MANYEPIIGQTTVPRGAPVPGRSNVRISATPGKSQIAELFHVAAPDYAAPCTHFSIPKELRLKAQGWEQGHNPEADDLL